MALKFRIDKLEDAPEAARSLYVEKDGKFELPIEGVVTKDKLDEFRNNNIELKNQLSDLTKKFEGVDPELFKTLSAEHQKLKDKKMIDAGKIEELLNERTAAMRADYDKKLKAQADELGITKTQLEKMLIDNALQTEAAKAGVRPAAMEDVLLRGRQRFKLKDGTATPTMPDGKVVYGKDGVTPQSMAEWLADLAPTAPHLFESSQGGGAENKSGNKNSGAKTMKRADFEALDPASKMSKSKEGIVITD